MDRLRGVAVERHADAQADDLEALVARAGARSASAIGGVRRRWPVMTVTSWPRAGELRRLSVDVLGDAAKHRVVVIGDDGDPHAEARASISSPLLLGTLDTRVPRSAEASGILRARCRSTSTSARTGTASTSCSASPTSPLTVCEVCGKPVQRVLHAPAVHFKGKGFYTTDYGRGARARTATRPTRARRRSPARRSARRRRSSAPSSNELRAPARELGLQELRLEELRLELGLQELGRRRLVVEQVRQPAA